MYGYLPLKSQVLNPFFSKDITKSLESAILFEQFCPSLYCAFKNKVNDLISIQQCAHKSQLHDEIYFVKKDTLFQEILKQMCKNPCAILLILSVAYHNPWKQ